MVIVDSYQIPVFNVHANPQVPIKYFQLISNLNPQYYLTESSCFGFFFF